jgi:CubicO group peptidase (beta-lactamase class C family)
MNFDSLTDFVNGLLKIIPGCSLIINYRHKQVYKKSFGYAELENKKPFSSSTKVNLWSATKPITCVAGLKLFEEGKFLLNDKLYDYLPEFKNMYKKTNYEIKLVDRPILIKDLFTMSAGFTYDINSVNMKAFKAETNGECPTYLLSKYLSKDYLSFEPGTHWSYSLCHDVLGVLIEKLSGFKLGEYINLNIFKPLGMSNSTFDRTNEIIKKMAYQYSYNSKNSIIERVTKDNMYYLGSKYQSGGAGIISTADDYIKFAEMLCNNGKTEKGKNIISKESIDLMKINQLNNEMVKDINWPQLTGYSYGLGVRTLIDKTKGSLSNLGEFGWSGYAGCYLLVDIEKELSVFYCQHMYNNQEEYIHPRIRNIIYSCLD